MRQFILTVIVCVLGCGSSVTSLPPTIDESTGLTLAFDLSFVVENPDGRQVGCATLVAVEEQSFLVAAPLELASQTGCRLVEWRGAYDGQKFERVVFDKFEIQSNEPSLKLAMLRVSGKTMKQPVPFANTESRDFQASFPAYSSRASKPRPIEVMTVKVPGFIKAQATPDLPSGDFFQVESELDFMVLGSPLVTQQGELAGVAIGSFWNSTLYCPAPSLRKLISASKTAEVENAP